MEAYGREVASALAAGDVLALIGGLGAGKTHFTKGLAAGLGYPGEVTSPTFALIHEYRGGRLPVFHLDFYRLNSAEELIGIGWDELFDEDGVVVAEWGDRFPEVWPETTQLFRFELAEGGRWVEHAAS
jgi:tRNA threonylcarbamoyladenosine biosynthesis protein TsaE